MTDKEYRELAKEYLEPIKLISMKIKSLKAEHRADWSNKLYA